MDENEKISLSDDNNNVKEQTVEKVEEVEEEKNKQQDKKNENEQKNTGKKKNTKIIVLFVLVLTVVIVAVALWWFVFKTKTIDLSDCFKVTYSGYSDHATAKVEINENELKKKIEDSSVTKNFIKELEYDVENTSDLSNGDELTIKLKVPSSFLKDERLKLKDTTIKIKVSGIEEAKSLDMSKYIEIKCKGFNKHATAEANLKKKEMEKDLGSDIYSKLKNRITLKVENNENLSNDDEVTVKVDISSNYLEEIGVNLDSDTVKIKVDGLKDAKEVDAFKDIKIDLTGMSPNINISISNNSEDEFLKTVKYKTSKNSGIANGETITITATEWDEDLAEENGVVLKETTMKYKVEGQSAYIFNKSEITDSVKNELKTIFTSKATSKANENYDSLWNDNNLKWLVKNQTDYQYIDDVDVDRDLSFGTPEVMSIYLLTKKDDVNNVDEINMITAIVKVPCISAKAGVTYNWYVTIQAANASLKEDGTISDNTNYTINAADGKDEEKAYEKYINSMKDKYNVERISL